MKYRSTIQLLRKYLRGRASAEEIARVEKWYKATADITDDQTPEINVPEETKEKIYQRILSVIEQHNRVIPFYKSTLFRITAVAALLIIFAGVYFLWPVQSTKENKTVSLQPQLKNDVAPPTTNKAILTLADGTKINIDSAGKGVFATQGNIHVIKQADGEIAYKGKNADVITYNTLTVPKGSKPFKLNLADGSEVWLNVASSITYPTSFSGAERKVIITGEVYFEVAKNKAMPFIVQQANSDMKIRVLGTHFDVNTYDDEAARKITLLEGSVDVFKSTDHILLSPGQQAQLYNNSAIKKTGNINVSEIMAWKNGTFYFDGADIKTIMRQVEKWYNVDVMYKDNISYSFVANISRDVNVSQLLRILELTDLVHFKIEGNKITVMK